MQGEIRAGGFRDTAVARVVNADDRHPGVLPKGEVAKSPPGPLVRYGESTQTVSRRERCLGLS